MKLMHNDQQIDVLALTAGGVIDITDDPMNVANATSYNVYDIFSDYYFENGVVKRRARLQMLPSSGWEGVCFDLSKFELENGESYTISFTLKIPSDWVWSSQNYTFGMLHSSTAIAETSQAFNLNVAVNFTHRISEQDVSMTFTATADNYLVLVLAIADGNDDPYKIITLDNIEIVKN